MIDHNVATPFSGSLEQAASQIQAEIFVVVRLADHLVMPRPALEYARLLRAHNLQLTND
jgi:hypothetical protein